MKHFTFFTIVNFTTHCLHCKYFHYLIYKLTNVSDVHWASNWYFEYNKIVMGTKGKLISIFHELSDSKKVFFTFFSYSLNWVKVLFNIINTL